MKIQTHRLIALGAVQEDSIVAGDGTLWSHAATLGTRFKGSEFTIDQPTIENFVRVFTSGYPSKVPVDYEHGTTNGATDLGSPVPKAGDAVELRGVFKTADFTGDLRAAAEKLSAKAGRTLDDPKNLGLWMRWKPTTRALGMIQQGEYSELSIAFGHDVPNNVDGKSQGPALLAVALTNRPFLDDMLSVAASRDLGGSPAAPGKQENTMSTKITMLAAAAALFGKPMVDEDQVVAEITSLQSELPQLRQLATEVSAEVGETDRTKVGAKVKELKSKVATFELEARQAKEKAVKTTVDATLKEHESKFIPAMRPMLERELTREIGEGKEPKDTEVVKALTAAPPTGITKRASGADDGSSSADSGDDVKLDAKARELMNTDATLKELNAKSGFGVAFPRALTMAREALGLPAKLKVV
jgi:phage I-like protein